MNSLLLLKISTLIREKTITLTLKKVKAHTGIVGNEIADNAAKQAISKGRTHFNNSNTSLAVDSIIISIVK